MKMNENQIVKMSFAGLVAVAFLCVGLPQAKAALIAEWQFNSYGAGGGNLSNFLPNAGTQSGTAGLTTTTSINTPTRITGTTVNQFAASAPNYGFQVNRSGGQTVNATLTFHVSGTSLHDFVITYASGASGAYVQTWSYSLTGTAGTFVNITPTITAATTATFNGTAYTANFSGITAINGQANVYFRDIFTIDSGGGASVRFDNIATTAAPEPVNVALGLFGFGAVAVGAGRRYLRNRS
jgi:hypothetical protein